MSLKTENSRRVAKSRPVCVGLKSSISNAFLYEKLVYKIVRQHRLNVGQLKADFQLRVFLLTSTHVKL